MASSKTDSPTGPGSRNATPNITVDPTLTEDDIRQAGNKQLREVADKFSPRVSTENCQSLSEKRERLMCAFRQARNMSRNLDVFGSLMDELKTSDGKMRAELSRLFEQSGALLTEIVHQERVIGNQLEQEPSTRDYSNRIQAFCHHLKQHQCRVVVAGQVSAGKSTLMNLFLGEEVLPSRMLSCTATVCELMYGEEHSAEVVHEDGSADPIIPYEDKDKYIFKKDERERRFDHELVRLYMPVPFLKSGIALVDTPGVGENKEMWEVLTDYVTKNDVFGFIFVIKCDDSGGVLKRFQEMLRELSMIKDQQGHFKLDPKSVIFVANFWDKVAQKDKPAVEERIKDTLQKQPCLQGIDLNSQLFFVDSRFAWSTWQVGLISEDYEKLIQGVERFFPIGHKRKLRLSYMWLENVLFRVLHPVQAFLNKADRSTRSFTDNASKIGETLSTVETKASSAKKKLADILKKKRVGLHEEVKKFLNDPVTMKKVSTWKHGEAPKEEYGDSWVLIEERIDQEIDARVSLVLQEWEVKEQHFKKAEQDVIREIKYEYESVYARLEEVEKNIRDMSGEKTQDQKTSRASKVDSMVEDPEDKSREFKVDVAHDFGQVKEPSSMYAVLNNLKANPASLFQKKSRARSLKQRTNAEEFQADKAKYMERRSAVVFDVLKNSEQTIRHLVEDQWNDVEKGFEYVSSSTSAIIQSNRDLLEQIQQDTRGKSQLQDTYRPLAERLNELLEATISFMYRNIHDYNFPQVTLETQSTSPAATKGLKRSTAGTSGCASAHAVVSTMLSLSNPPGCSLQQMQAGSAFKLRHLFHLAANVRKLRMYRKAEFVGDYLGSAICNKQPGLVFKGLMESAREKMIENLGRTAMGRNHVINSNVKPFMLEVSKAVEFLHLKHLVHVELSLDSVFLQGGKPKLSNFFESMEIAYPSLEKAAGNYVYMAPETFPRETFPRHGGKKYSSAADVYALGLMLLELWVQCDDLYATQKKKQLRHFLESPAPGEALLKCSNDSSINPIQRQNLPEELIGKCLKFKPKERPSVTEFIQDFQVFCETSYSFGEMGNVGQTYAEQYESSV